MGAQTLGMIIETLIYGPLKNNCYLVSCESSKEAVVIDPGGRSNNILRMIEQNSLTVKYIVNTHKHRDHTGVNGAVKEATGAVLAAGVRDASDIKNPAVDRLLKEGDRIVFGDCALEVIETPGHTPGGICLYASGSSGSPGSVFTGDTLFHEDVGRTDLPGGDEAALHASIAKLLKLPEDTTVYPGHEEFSSIRHERLANPMKA